MILNLHIINRIAILSATACALSLSSGCMTTKAEADAAKVEFMMLNMQSEQIISEINQPKESATEFIMASDNLIIQVWLRDKKTQFTGFPVQQEIPRSGEVFIPNIGVITVLGKTDEQIKAILSEHFDKILVDATLVVEHSQKIRPNQQNTVQEGRYVSVMGWVRKPGLYPLGQGSMTLRDAIAVAGGSEQFAAKRRVYLVRGDIKKPKVIQIDLENIQRGKDISSNFTLFHNDAIYVPPVKMWKAYDVIRTALLPITGVRDALLTGASATRLQ